MAITYSADIQTAIDTGAIAATDLVRVDFGNGTYRYWSSDPVPDKHKFDGSSYAVRILPMSEMPFSVSDEDDSTDLVIANGDRYVQDLMARGLRFHRARVHVVRLYYSGGGTTVNPPNNIVGTWSAPYWAGTITKVEIDHSEAKITVASGLRELNRRGLWQFDQTCNAMFADGLHCPYDPLAGKGLPERRFKGTATGGSTTTLVDTGADFSSVQVGWIAVNTTDKSTGQVTTVATTTLTCAGGFANGTDNTFASGDKYIVGPPFSSCPLSVAGCGDRGMYGPHGNVVSADLNKDEHRYYQGYAQPADVPFRAKARDFSGNYQSAFSSTSQTNQGIQGQPIPWVFGKWRNREMLLYGAAFETDHVDCLFIAGMGRCINVGNVVVDGLGPDDLNRTRAATAPQQEESFLVINFDTTNSNDASSADFTLEQRLLGIGARQAFGVLTNTNFDTYSEIPYLFNAVNQSGISFSRLSMIRFRIEPTGGLNRTITPSGSADIWGVRCRVVPGTTGVDGASDWTAYPNPIQVAYHFLRDTAAGAGLDDNQLNLTSFAAAHNHCVQKIAATQTSQSTISGTVIYGPDDAGTSPAPGGKNWVVVSSPQIKQGSLVGATIVVQTAGGPASRTIISAPCAAEDDGDDDPAPPKIPVLVKPPAAAARQPNCLITVDSEWPAGQVPAGGESYTIVNTVRVRRYQFNGALTEPGPVAEVLQSILDNCDAKFTQSGGKISVSIPASVDLDAVDADTIFTDKGSSPNIIWKNEKSSTVKWVEDDLEDTPTAIGVEFFDETREYELTKRKVVNLPAQRYVAEAFNEKRREKEESTLTLNGTSSLDQALRLAALKLRRKGPLPGNRPSGQVEFDLWIGDAQKLEPWVDVHIIESDVIPAHVGRYFRLVEKKDNPDRFTTRVKWRPHRNEWYDDSADDIGLEERPRPIDFTPDGEIIHPKFDQVESDPFVDGSGNYRERLVLTFTPPAT